MLFITDQGTNPGCKHYYLAVVSVPEIPLTMSMRHNMLQRCYCRGKGLAHWNSLVINKHVLIPANSAVKLSRGCWVDRRGYTEFH